MSYKCNNKTVTSKVINGAILPAITVCNNNIPSTPANNTDSTTDITDIESRLADYQLKSQKNIAGGYVGLNVDGLVDYSKLADYIGTNNPTVNDDEADTSGKGTFRTKSLWMNTSEPSLWVCIDASEGVADWQEVPLLNDDGELVGPVINRSDTAANLSAVVPESGEWVYETDTKYAKIGDGSTATGSLSPAGLLILGSNGSIRLLSSNDEGGARAIDLQQNNSLGSFHIPLGDDSGMFAGQNNRIEVTGNKSVVLGGFNSACTSTEAGNIGGQNITNNSNQTIFLGGNNNTSVNTATQSIVFGSHANAIHPNSVTQGGEEFADVGDNQSLRLHLYTITSDATTRRLAGTVAAFSEFFAPVVPTDHAWLCDLRILASEDGMANVKMFHRTFLAVNEGGTLAVSSVNTIGTDQTFGSPGAWSVAIDVDNSESDKKLEINVTGEAATDIRWSATLDITENAWE